MTTNLLSSCLTPCFVDAMEPEESCSLGFPSVERSRESLGAVEWLSDCRMVIAWLSFGIGIGFRSGPGVGALGV
jgi:hypothetical protein